MKRYIVLVEGDEDVQEDHKTGRHYLNSFEADALAVVLAKEGKEVAIYAEIARVHPGTPTKEEPR